jgi:GNAT superfamily N-acetyltransferase
MKERISIRKAKEKDIPSLYSLVRELAIYEKAEKELLIDENYYLQEFSRNTFEAIVAVYYEIEIVGTCIFYMTYSTWKGRMLYLEDFVVKESYRKHGIGQLLYDTFLNVAKEKDCTMVKWQVLDWNEPAVKFYEKNGATIEKNWWSAKVIF